MPEAGERTSYLVEGRSRSSEARAWEGSRMMTEKTSAQLLGDSGQGRLPSGAAAACGPTDPQEEGSGAAPLMGKFLLVLVFPII